MTENPGCLFSFLAPFFKAKAESLPYHLRDDFLSPAELSFRHVLASVVKDRAAICPMVRLADIIYVEKCEKWQTYNNRINRKHVDFLLCDCRTLKPLAAVELDDSSHNRRDREERDEFVDDVFKAAGLPLVHIRAQRDYSTHLLAEQILPLLNKQRAPGTVPETPTAVPAATVATAAPMCPKCAIPLVLRPAKAHRESAEISTVVQTIRSAARQRT